jgi:hypothetical protein
MKSVAAVVLALFAVACADASGPAPIEDPLARGGGKADGGARALAVRSWDGPTNVFPAELASVDANYDASHCELFVNGFGRGSFSNGGASATWLEAWISVPPQDGEILDVGMFVSTSGAGDSNWVMLGELVEPDYWRTGFTIERNFPAESHVVDDVAFFVDREVDGEVVRLWQSARGVNFDVEQTFLLPPSDTVGIGGGAVVYANEGAPVFDQKHACR